VWYSLCQINKKNENQLIWFKEPIKMPELAGWEAG
jgi:hypothetical protein